MKKIFSIILIIFCIFSFNTCFNAQKTMALPFTQEQSTQVAVEKQNEDVLEKPVFAPEQKKVQAKEFTGKLSSIIIKVFGGALLFLVIVICLSFIWFANLQRQNERRKSANRNHFFQRPRDWRFNCRSD